VSTVAGYIRCAFTPSFNWTTLGGLRAYPVCPPHSKPPLHIALSCSAAAALLLSSALSCLAAPTQVAPGVIVALNRMPITPNEACFESIDPLILQPNNRLYAT
jgi:hypothetical protein